MSIAGSYQNIKGVIVDRRRRPLARRKKLIEREVWVVEAGDIIQNVGITIMIDSRFSGPASATPQLGTRNICIVSGPLPGSPQLASARDDELVTVDVVIVVENDDYVVKELAIHPRQAKAVGYKKGKKSDSKQEPAVEDAVSLQAAEKAAPKQRSAKNDSAKNDSAKNDDAKKPAAKSAKSKERKRQKG